MNQMDVDPTTPSSSGSRRAADFPPASSSANKCAKILLPDGQLATLSSNMDRSTSRRMWQIRVDEAEADDSLCVGYTFGRFDGPRTGIGIHKYEKGSVITDVTLDRADDIVKSLNLKSGRLACGMVLKGTIGLTCLPVVRTFRIIR
jgi:hypothetical protein